MKSGKGFFLVMVTAPNLKVARKLARACCEGRLAACVNIVPGLESHYWWEGKLEKGREVLLLIKTRSPNLELLEKVISKEHPYDTPEIISIKIAKGSKKYLSWWLNVSSVKN